jgi:RNA-binding protein 39
MFDAATETEPDWDKNLEEDVREECQAHGPVTHVRVVKESEVRAELSRIL